MDNTAGVVEIARARSYSAVKFGVGSVVLAVSVTIGTIVAQAAVLTVGFRPVAATEMALMGAGSLLFTQVSVGGSYFGDIFFGLLVAGPGIGLVFVTSTVAALAGVPERESGLASGLSNTALQVGGALGVAIVTPVAVSRSDHYLASTEGADPLVVLNEGFQAAFLALVALGSAWRSRSCSSAGREERHRSESRGPGCCPERPKGESNGKDRDQRERHPRRGHPRPGR
jgi:hypothetical protein